MSDRLCDYSDCVEQCMRKQYYCKYHMVAFEAHSAWCSISFCKAPASYKFKQYYYCYGHKTPFSRTIIKYACTAIGCTAKERQLPYTYRVFCKKHREEL